MCDPVTIAATTTMVSTVYSMQQQRAQGKLQRMQGEHQQNIDNYNARLAENEAQDIRNKGIEQENIQRLRTAEVLSKQRAQLASRNVDLNTGSALQLQNETVELGEVDALRIRSNTDNQVQSALSQADLLRSNGQLASVSGQFAQQSANNQAVGTLLSGTASTLGTGVADKWFTPNSSAVTTNTAKKFLEV